MEFSKSLKNIRKKNNISQEGLAEKLGVSRQTVSSWENDKSYPDIASIVKISEIFNISLDELLKGYKNLKKEDVSKIKTMAFGKLNDKEIKHTEDYIQKLIDKIDNII